MIDIGESYGCYIDQLGGADCWGFDYYYPDQDSLIAKPNIQNASYINTYDNWVFSISAGDKKDCWGRKNFLDPIYYY